MIRTRRDGGILEITIDRPKANVIDLAMSRELGLIYQSYRDDPDLAVAIFRTEGSRFFSAGWDLKAAAAGDAVDGDYGVGGFGGLQELRDLDKPVIACVDGMAVGGGFEMALACDLILASDHSRFCLPEVHSGILADAATLKLTKRIPYHVAMEMLFTGRWMDAEEASRWGLVNEVLPSNLLEERAWQVARVLAARSATISAMKHITRHAEGRTVSAALAGFAAPY